MSTQNNQRRHTDSRRIATPCLENLKKMVHFKFWAGSKFISMNVYHFTAVTTAFEFQKDQFENTTKLIKFPSCYWQHSTVQCAFQSFSIMNSANQGRLALLSLYLSYNCINILWILEDSVHCSLDIATGLRQRGEVAIDSAVAIKYVVTEARGP